MTQIIKTPGGVVLIPEPEVAEKCELCGLIDELRPYGPNGARVCFTCGMKDEAGMKARFRALLEGKP